MFSVLSVSLSIHIKLRQRSKEIFTCAYAVARSKCTLIPCSHSSKAKATRRIARRLSFQDTANGSQTSFHFQFYWRTLAISFFEIILYIRAYLMSIVILIHFYAPSHRFSPSLVLDVNMAFTTKAAFSLNKPIVRIPRENSVNRTGLDVQTNVYKSKMYTCLKHTMPKCIIPK